MEQSNKVAPVVIWDVGGTLVDCISYEEALSKAFLAAEVRPEQLHPDSLQRAQKTYFQIEPHWRTLGEEEAGFRTIAALMLEASPFCTSEQIERLGVALASYEATYSPVAGIPQLLPEVGHRGIRQAIVSNWPPSLSRFLSFHGLRQHFTIIVGSGEEGICKPNVRLFERALERLKIQAYQAIFVGNDPETDMLPARALGLETIHFDPRRQHSEAEIHEVAGLRQKLLALLELPDDNVQTGMNPL